MGNRPLKKKTPHRLSSAQKHEAYERFKAGDAAKKVAQDFGFSRSAIHYLFAKFRRHGEAVFNTPPAKRGAKKIPAMTRDDR